MQCCNKEKYENHEILAQIIFLNIFFIVSKITGILKVAKCKLTNKSLINNMCNF